MKGSLKTTHPLFESDNPLLDEKQAVTEWQAAVAPGAWPCNVLSNHDLVRHVTRHGEGLHADGRAKVAAALVLTLRGTPFLYYGEELAMRSGHIPRRDIVDPPGKRYWPFYRGRDNARTPMQWDGSRNAGFTHGKPWLPVGSSYRKINVASEREDPRSVLNFYRGLLRLRRTSPALRRGSYRWLVKRPVEGLAYLRETPEQAMLVLLNFYSWSISLQFDAPLPTDKWRVCLSNAGAEGERTVGDLVSLAPCEVVILEAVR
ncbi:MAG: DUF3459 domain-containing protein [Chloroflexi bacterium]|nr:DUF3459 domain-containing protein [Chloroflexota bacterium]